MKLIVTDQNDIESASSIDVEAAIDRLSKAKTEFVIIEDENKFIQIALSNNGFVVEYQEGSVDNHFQSSEIISRAIVLQILKSYLIGDLSWKSMVNWKQIVFEKSGFNFAYIGVMLLMIAAYVFYKWMI